MNKNDEIVVENGSKLINILKRIGIFAILVLGYLFVPQIIGIIFYRYLKLSETISMFIGNISYVFILVMVYHNMFKEKLKDYKNNFSNYFGDSLKYWGFGLLVMFISNMILAYVIFNGDIAANEELNRSYITSNPVIGFMSISLMAPFVEEMIFRYGLRDLVGKSKFFPLISAVCFGLPHVIAGINNISVDYLQFLYVIPYGSLGYAFGYIYNKTDNIFSSMMTHALHNFMCFVMILNFV